MIKKIITIVLPIIAVTAAIFVFGLKVYQDSFNKFQYDGYVIGADTGKESLKYNFSKDEKYKVNETKGEVAFKDSEENDIVVPETTFVHYMDGSISTFKKAVVLNLANVKSDSLQYYNVFNGSVFTKTSDGYQIQYLEQTLSFDNFLVKISDTKYMLVGKGLTVKYGDKEETVNDGFLEINYLDGNIVRIENQDFGLQNISTDISIEHDGIKLDLLNKKIIYNEETKVDLGEITIDSDDNIEIVPDEDNTKIMENEEQENKNEIADIQNQPVVAPGVDVSGMESGIIDTSVEKVEQIVNDNKKIPDAEFKINSFEVKPNLMSTNITIEDEEGTLKGDVTIKIINTATNEEHCKRIYAYGSNIGDYSCTTLSPGVNYLLIAHSKYEKKEITYEKDFIQRTFITPTAGISIEKDYVATDEISFKVNIKEESEVTKFDYILIDSAEGRNSRAIANGSFERESTSNTTSCNNISTAATASSAEEGGGDSGTGSGNAKINECYVTVSAKDSNLKPNKKYSLIITNIQNKNVVISNYEIYKTESTLKEKPQYNGTTAIVNKLSSKFVIYLNNLQDVNNSVISYKADVYEADTGTFISSYETSASSQIEIPVGNHDQTGVIRGNRYIAEIYLKYYDNEKEYEKYIGFQNLGMDSLEAPKVTFEESYVAHDRIKGNVVITDESGTIVTGTNIVIKMTNQSDGKKASYPAIFSQTDRNKNYISIPIDFTGLKQNSSYLFEVEATINFGDQTGDKQNTTTNIGAFVVNTITPAGLRAIWRSNETTGTDDGAFSISFALTQSPDSLELKYKKTDKELALLSPEELTEYNSIMADVTDYEIKTLETMTFRIRKQNAVITDNAQCTADNQCWLLPFRDIVLSGNGHFELSDIKDRLYAHRNNYSGNLGVSDIEGGDYKIKFTPKNNTNESYAMFNITDELQYATYVIEVVQSTDYTEYQNTISVSPSDHAFTPNSKKSEPIIANGYFVEEFIYEKKLHNAGDNNTSTMPQGYKITPKLNSSSIPEGALLDFEYILLDLSTNNEISLTNIDKTAGAGNFLKYENDNSHTISFTMTEYNSYQTDDTKDMKRGKPYGFCYKVNVYKDKNGNLKYDKNTDEIISSFSCNDSDRAFVNDKQLRLTAASLSAWHKKTEQDGQYTKLTYGFTLSGSSSLYDQLDENGNNIGKVLKYKTQSLDDYSLVSCVNSSGKVVTNNCLDSTVNPDKEFFIRIRSNGSLMTRIDYKLLDGSSADIPNNSERYVAGDYQSNHPTNELPVSTIIDPLNSSTNSIKYELDQSDEKNTKIVLMGTFTSQSLKNYVAGVRIYMYARNDYGDIIEKTHTLLYKDFDNYDFVDDSSQLPTVTISNSELTNLQEQQNVVIRISLLYDRHFYGFEQENTIGYYAVSTRLGSVDRYDDFSTYPNSKINTKIFSKIEYSGSSNGDITIYPDKLSSKEENEAKEFIDLKHSQRGKYYTDLNSKNNMVQISRLSMYDVACNTADKCKLNVKLTDPVFLMEKGDITPLLGEAKFKFSIMKNQKIRNLVVKQNFYRTTYTKLTDEYGREYYDYVCDKEKKLEYISGHLYSFDDQPVEGTDVLTLSANKYEIHETKMPITSNEMKAYYCTTFTWSGDFVSSENEDGTIETIRKEDQPFAYSSAYESVATNPQDREYVFRVKSAEFITSGKVTYDTGTDQYHQKSEVVTQDKDSRRTMTFTIRFEELTETDWFQFSIEKPSGYNSSGVPIYSGTDEYKINIPIERIVVSDLNREQKTITGTFSIDQIVGDDNAPIELQPGSYGLVVKQYRKCVGGTLGNTGKDDEYDWSGEDPSENEFRCRSSAKETLYQEVEDDVEGYQRLRTQHVNFSFNIIPAAVRITRVASTKIDSTTGEPQAGTFGIVLTVDDKYRTVGNYACANCEEGMPLSLDDYIPKSYAEYNIKVQTDEDTYIPLDDMPLRSNTAVKTFDPINIDVCVENGNPTPLCNIIVEYKTDTDNVEFTPLEYQEYKKAINIKFDSDLGIISAALASGKVTLNFSSFYQPWKATKYMYTIQQDNSQKGTAGDGETEFTPTTTSDVLTLPITFSSFSAARNKPHTFVIQFKDDEDNIITTWQAQGLSYQ